MNFHSPLASIFQKSTFRQQLLVPVATGVLLLALSSSLVISWQSGREIRQNRQAQGQRLSDSFARQARLALISDVSETMADAVAGALAFPDVDRVEIRRLDGRLLTAHGAKGVALVLGDESPPKGLLASTSAFLDAENSQAWHFVAPVHIADHNSPNEMEVAKGQTIGYVRVALSKASLGSALLTLFALNMAIALTFAVFFLLITRKFTQRMTQPLMQLAQSMGRAGRGESGVRAELTGPRDIAAMADAFNRMMTVLDERDQALRMAHLKAEFAPAIRLFLEDMSTHLEELDAAVVVEEHALVAQTLHLELASEPEVCQPMPLVGEALVLIVDDDPSTRSTLSSALQRSGFVVTEAANGSEVEAEVQRMRPDVILMDALMPVMDGFTACARLRDSPEWRHIPVLMITALEDSASIERAFAAGANDYIPKPIHLAVVNQRVRRLVEATRAERHVRHLAYKDSLTGLPNRTLFNDHLSRSIARAEPTAKSLALLYLDLDRFKFVNDTLGHETGDKLLKTVSERIRGCVRASDCVARLGGDEFAIVIDDLPNVGVASTTAQKICHAVTAPFEIDGHDIVVSASIGIAVYPINGTDASTLLRHADTAMYRAKKKSSGFQFFEENMEVSASEHLRFEGALRRALERNEIVVYFQPIADAADCRIVGVEALARWRHPSRGLVSPLEFIPLAEETGLIIPIGEAVLRAACGQLKKWHDAGSTGLHVTVNLSGLQLQQVNFIDTLRSALQDTGVDPRCLTLELTESMLMEHAEETLLLLRALKATGVELAIDDFGTGYSSLAYLRRFPVDVLKIDRAFTRDMTTNLDDASIVSGIISLAHNLRLKVVAEGVETEEQRLFLAGLSCDCIQGYLLSQPVPADMFESRFLIENHTG